MEATKGSSKEGINYCRKDGNLREGGVKVHLAQVTKGQRTDAEDVKKVIDKCISYMTFVTNTL